MVMDYGKKWNPAEHYKRDEVAENYDRQRFSGLAGRTFNFLEKRLIRRAFDDLPRSTTLVVDVPCGTGRLAEVLLDMGFRVTGIDIALPMLEVARRRLGRFGDRFNICVADARELVVARKFEAALCARVLMHFPMAEQLLLIRAVTAATTRRVVFTQGLDTAYHRLRRRLKQVLRHEAPAVYPLTSKDLRTLIEAAGLREIRRYSLLPMISEEVIVVCEPAVPRRVGDTGQVEAVAFGRGGHPVRGRERPEEADFHFVAVPPKRP